MKHARDDYNRIQDPAINEPALLSPGSTPIGEDEPVFLLRAQDKHFCTMLSYYGLLIANEKTSFDREMAAAVMNQIAAGSEWQREHGCKTPDL